MPQALLVQSYKKRNSSEVNITIGAGEPTAFRPSYVWDHTPGDVGKRYSEDLSGRMSAAGFLTTGSSRSHCAL